MSWSSDSEKHHRRSIRLKGYDYSLAGFYFVTLVAEGRECLFGEVMNEKVILNEIGKLVIDYWLIIPENFNNTILDEYVLMPNHLHGIIFLEEAPGRGEASHEINIRSPRGLTRDASPKRPIGTRPGSIEAIIQNFKSVSTRMVNNKYFEPGNKLWQRNYHDRIIRNDRELKIIRGYIRDNPLNWELDKDNPANI